MPWCPKCGTEYRDGFDTCADCKEPLVHQLPELAQQQRFSIISWLIQALSIPSVAVLAALIFYPLYYAAYFLYGWVVNNFSNLILCRAIEYYVIVPASLLTGFSVGAIYKRKLSLIELSVGFILVSILIPISDILIAFSMTGIINVSWQEAIICYFPIILLFLLPAGYAAWRGRQITAKNYWKQLCWLVGTLAVLFITSLLMLPIYHWLNS